VTFADCKLDDANLRLAKLQRVRFSSCVLAGAELVGARLEKVAFPASDLAGADLSSTHCTEVDLRGARLGGLRGVASLRGAVIGTEQLIGFAPALAQALGIAVRDD
jgi:uncharacterized protein YjbI with pentapeptide repeats